ncbi:hypothetical protein HDV00_003841 [Rhizophlyctis rosea]|nr:hypothetical protein HDV00_003841 [Rhizophlyctis rosea]
MSPAVHTATSDDEFEPFSTSPFHPRHDADLVSPSYRAQLHLPSKLKVRHPIRELDIPKRTRPETPSVAVQTPKEATNIGIQAIDEEVETRNKAKERELQVLRDLEHQKREAVGRVSRVEGQLEELHHERDELARSTEELRQQLQAEEKKDCLQCDNWKLQNEGMQQQLDNLREENAQLNLQIQRSEHMVERALSIQQTVKSLTSHLTHLTDLTRTQTATINTLSEQKEEVEKRLLETTARFDQSVKTNKQLLAKCNSLEARAKDLEKKGTDWKLEKEHNARWRRGLEDMLRDWQKCIAELGLPPFSVDDTSSGAILSSHIVKMKNDMAGSEDLLATFYPVTRADVQKTGRDAQRALGKLEKEHAACLQRYISEMEKREAEIKTLKDHLESVVETADRTRRERDGALRQVQQLMEEKTSDADRLRRVLREKDEEILTATYK